MFRIQRGQGLQPHGGRRHYMPGPADPDILRPFLQPVGGQHGLTLLGHAPSPRKPLDRERLVMAAQRSDSGIIRQGGATSTAVFYSSNAAGVRHKTNQFSFSLHSQKILCVFLFDISTHQMLYQHTQRNINQSFILSLFLFLLQLLLNLSLVSCSITLLEPKSQPNPFFLTSVFFWSRSAR